MLKRCITFVSFMLLVHSLSLYARAVERPPLVIFISFSVPQKSIQSILDDAAKVNAPVLLRGLVHNSFKETLEKIYSISKNPVHGLQIDPESFKKYGILKVPAFLLRIPCKSNENCVQKYRVIYGDVVLEDVLKQFARDDDMQAIANNYLKAVGHVT